jgi:5-methylcytosine-specific restriction protein A
MPKRPPTLQTGTRKPPECRPSPSRRGYGRDWQRARAYHLAHNPLCEDCRERGLVVAATDVDHVLALSAGGTNDGSNLRSLCHACHSRKTVRVDGGLGNARGG